METDTIAALATPAGEGGIGVVRVSGTGVWPVVDALFKPANGTPISNHEHGTFAYGHVVEASGEKIDAALALIMHAPKSYTCEDTVEIQGHGGTVVMRRILWRALEAGARMAEPGEFTKRAFLNGRIDLMQAEGVYDLVRARSDRAAQVALEQMEGALSQSFNAIYDAFLEVASNLETTLDFVEDELPDDVFTGIAQRLDDALEVLDRLLETWNEGRLLREGVRVAILGRPNVGKSTLLNTLLGFDRAIVSGSAGTTRDAIEEGVVLNGIPLRLVDTAGLRKAACDVEAEGIRRAEAHGANAQVLIYMLDASKPLHEEDRARLDAPVPEKRLVVLNKVDRGLVLKDVEGVSVSLLTGEGVERLRYSLAKAVEQGGTVETAPHAVVSERHRALLVKARDEARLARARLDEHVEQQAALATEHLRTALESLGQATGRVYHDELLDNIFSRFCIGK